MASVGTTIPHDSAVGHVTGSAPYIDDLEMRRDELLVSFVGSPIACGKLISVDVSQAQKIEGVVAVFTAKEVGNNNLWGPLFHDEPFLAQDRLLYVGQPVAVIAAENQVALEKARAAIKVEFLAEPPILNLLEAIEQESFIGPRRHISRGNADEAIRNSANQLGGQFHVGGQEQFYLESQAAIAYPGEENQLIIHSSTQNPTEIQAVAAEVLGLSHHQVVCICKRMGGAFGGKETQAAIPALMVALVAQRTGRAARVVYNKDDDMCVTGKRHEYIADWSVGFDDDAIIGGIKFNFYSNGGCAADLSTSVMERTLLHADNCYYFENVELHGQVCFTNLPPNTAFRGFGGPQAVASIENVIHRMAEHLGIDAFEIRRKNVYGIDDRNITPYGQLFDRNHLPEILDQIAQTSNYKTRLARIESENNTDRMILRGLAMTPVKFGISFTTKFLNQANALVNVYTDGTVQVSTGGTEMGQGLNTKIRQLVADELGVPYFDVILMPTSTEKSNNTSPTAASAGTDHNGAAAIDACRQIKARLAEYAASLFASAEDGLVESPTHVVFAEGLVSDARRPDKHISFGKLAAQARRERIDLGARGFYLTPGVDFNRETGKGNPFLYFTQGAAVTEVTIDRFTGELSVPQVDLLIDIGKSINPGVDMGQITGGFIQGMGWATAESLVYDDNGKLLSHSPTTYKIPVITDVPPVFNCRLFDSDDNIHNVRRSKAVGEPPLLLGVSVWAAVKHALSCLPSQVDPQFSLPATGEEILRCLTACSMAAAQANERV